ncbi:hypothetical protein Sulku_1707 [Sulfuricurvum kujiense DSM 16994]|uniref:PD-(D/E)XK endonuclease-like domain-containing protein n=1 Tax=Sulfuricurvum kujiense (strain ATCC BAA-921 / DSM 16994 / JCM 11577 / YK-1) TaxID=709032 RepID=E4U0W6_SULKY|nr:PD-(D/E)XK nuclease family protein [Sulfuricurvum kujiense]ADR34368.1 hypothetical protein Sulku_1707 [Sulfuricurvum kujiense DSM 16994]
MKFNQTLFIARSTESVDIYLSNHTGAIKAITLGALLSSEFFSSSVAMDAMIGKMLLQRVVESLKLDHFDYLSTAESAIGELYAHILACKRNKISLESFDYPPQKLFELSIILDAYKTLKQSMGLKDNADVLIEAIEALKDTDYFNTYSKVVIDTFEENGVRFYGNTLEKEALDIIRALPHAQSVETDHHSVNPIATYTPQQSRFDEAIFAIKAVRASMMKDVKDTDIAIVTGNLGSYRRVLESYAPQYGMKLRFSSGTPMLQCPLFQTYLLYKNFEEFNEFYAQKVQEDLTSGILTYEGIEEVKQQFLQIKKLHLRATKLRENTQKLFDTKIDFKEMILSLAEETYIPPLKEDYGIWVAEPNQMTQHVFKHIIFIGTDLSVFPPKSKGNFLSTPDQREHYLGVDNSYLLSQYYFDQLRRNCESLHISTALQEGKKKLFISPIITDLPVIRLEGYEMESENEYLLHHRRFHQDERFEEYVSSMHANETGHYDGLLSEHRFESGVLSASSLNEYAKCPLRYLLTYQYGAEPLMIERDDDALEASDIGTIFHSIAEVFSKEVKAGSIDLGDEATIPIKERLQAIATDVHQSYIQKHIVDEGKTPNIFHEIVLDDLLKGLFEEHHERGLLIRFLDYVYTNGKLEHFEKSEQRFLLDDDFMITADKDKAIVKGFIDRIDLDKENKILTVIDYKTGKYSKDKENRLIEEMGSFKQFQLPLYLLYASQAYADHTIDSYLLAMRDGKGTKGYAHMSTDEANGLLFNEAYAQGLKLRIREIKAGIEEGDFRMSPSDTNCEYCPHERICHKDILPHKGIIDDGGDNE